MRAASSSGSSIFPTRRSPRSAPSSSRNATRRRMASPPPTTPSTASSTVIDGLPLRGFQVMISYHWEDSMRSFHRSWQMPDAAPIADVNTTPLIDVMLVLLIIFIISIPVMDHKVPIRLPPPYSESTDQPLAFRLSLDSAGRVYWNGEPVAESALPARLAAVQADPRAELLISADANTRYEAYDRVLAVVKRSGIERVGFVGNEGFAA